MELITTNGKIVKDGISSGKFIGITQWGKIVVYNCHLGVPPFRGFHVPCMFGTIEYMKNGVYHYRNAYIIKWDRGQHKIIIR